jgi:N-acetylglucosaminyldiphosphoundecaprenol N-acetyl-beta-D-mannosaminyltransferase
VAKKQDVTLGKKPLMNRFLKIAVTGIIACLVAAIFYLSWVPNPSMAALAWMPDSVGKWADTYGRLRTGIPFLALGGILGLLLALGRSPLLDWVGTLIALSALVSLAELGQLLLPHRVADLWDVFWGMAGSAVGLALVALPNWLFFRKVFRKACDSGAVPAGGSSHQFMKILNFLGLRFWNDQTEALLTTLDENGGLLVVPSAPSLAQMADDPLLKKAHHCSDWAVVDGGYVALVLRALGKRVTRISGLQLLEKTIDNSGEGVVPMKDRRIFWVVPSPEEEERIQKYLEGKGFEAAKQVFYRAPFYQQDEEFNDQVLHAKVRDEAPDWVILCLGGGRQEKLGHFLRHSQGTEAGGLRPPTLPTADLQAPSSNFPERGRRANGPVILCTGAAIAFFTGGQAKIPVWADRLYLGWLFRIFEKPGVFFPRYLRAFWHFPLLLLRERRTLFAGPLAPLEPRVGSGWDEGAGS